MRLRSLPPFPILLMISYVTKQPLIYYSNFTQYTIVRAYLWGQMHVSKWGLEVHSEVEYDGILSGGDDFFQRS